MSPFPLPYHCLAEFTLFANAKKSFDFAAVCDICVSDKAIAALTFLPIWLLGSGLNVFIGVKTAGYSVSDELPVFFIAFGVPTLALWWKLR